MLRRVRLFLATSLDGYIAGPGDTLDWLFTDDGYGYDEFIEQIDTLAMGRRTFETVVALGEWPYEGKQAWVWTRRGGADTPRARFTAQPPGEWLAERMREEGRDIWIVGGSELIRGFLDAYLVDEIAVAIHPVVLGGGVPLVPAGTRRHALRLTGHRAYPSGLVMNTYVVQR
ncbi:MAG TPA: dihydrofolate reductase family protein [Candidatus Acidoferrales bacterium]|nr:dihydrofolate reductase family protein [Candidatus Acidoferrales bacterium]